MSARLERGGKHEAVIREPVRRYRPRTLSVTGHTLLTLLILTMTFAPS